jgi:hypothetical protein
VTVDAIASLSFMGEIIEGMRRILEARSPWLRLRVQDSDIDAGWKTYVEASPDKRKLLVMWGLSNDNNYRESDRHPLFRPGELKPHPLTVMGFGPLGCSGSGTWDEKLLSYRDLAGKTLDLDSTVGNQVYIRTSIVEVLGLKDKVKITALGGGDRTVQTIKNRTVDVDVFHMTGPTRPVPQGIQMMTEGRAYMVDMTKDGIDAVAKANLNLYKSLYPFPIYRGGLPKSLGLRYDPVREPVAYCIGGQNPHFLMSPEADPEVVHELVSVMLKYKEDFDRYVTGDVAALKVGLPQSLVPKREYHPGARKAYEEAGVLYGLRAAFEAEQRRAQAAAVPLHFPDYMQNRLD